MGNPLRGRGISRRHSTAECGDGRTAEPLRPPRCVPLFLVAQREFADHGWPFPACLRPARFPLETPDSAPLCSLMAPEPQLPARLMSPALVAPHARPG